MVNEKHNLIRNKGQCISSQNHDHKNAKNRDLTVNYWYREIEFIVVNGLKTLLLNPNSTNSMKLCKIETLHNNELKPCKSAHCIGFNIPTSKNYPFFFLFFLEQAQEKQQSSNLENGIYRLLTIIGGKWKRNSTQQWKPRISTANFRWREIESPVLGDYRRSDSSSGEESDCRPRLCELWSWRWSSSSSSGGECQDSAAPVRFPGVALSL